MFGCVVVKMDLDLVVVITRLLHFTQSRREIEEHEGMRPIMMSIYLVSTMCHPYPSSLCSRF